MSGISSVLSVINGGGRPQAERAYIIPLDIMNNDAPLRGDRRNFQYFPETINDNKQTNYENKVIPGLSHPLYQWSNGGERIISFTAIFSRDESPTKQELGFLDHARSQLRSGWVVGSQGDIGDIGRKLSDPRNIDIPSAVSWLRSFVYPLYSNTYGTKLARPKPPAKLLLGFPNLRLNTHESGSANEVCCIMQQCDVAYEAFFSDGSPRLARVQLQFAETIQRSGKVSVHDAYAVRSVGLAGYRLSMSGKDKTRR